MISAAIATRYKLLPTFHDVGRTAAPLWPLFKACEPVQGAFAAGAQRGVSNERSNQERKVCGARRTMPISNFPCGGTSYS